MYICIYICTYTHQDTSNDVNPLYSNKHEAQLLFGRGLRAGIFSVHHLLLFSNVLYIVYHIIIQQYIVLIVHALCT